MSGRRRSGIALVVAGAIAATSSVAAGSSSAATVPQVGTVAVHRCHLVDEPVWCGSIRVRLDRTDPTAGTIGVGFGWVPASGTATGTVVAMEGGPGYPSTGSAVDFLDMLGPLHRTRNLLVVDARGTGRSALIDCAMLQSYKGNTTTAHFQHLVAQCGEQLNHTYRRADGSFVHASDLFNTATVTRDLADVLHRLGLSSVDLYGDSYGTYFAQSFLSHYPELLRSVVLDSAYEARDLDPWYVTTVTTARRAFETACTRSLACDAAAGSGAWGRIGRLAESLRHKPIHGMAPGVGATLVPTTVGVRQLVDMVNDAGYDYAPYRSLDAAARAYLDHGDARPLLRQWAQDFGWDDSDYYGPAHAYSDGDFYAVGCTDYPQLFDRQATPAVRRQQLAASIAELPADTFAPFTTAEWIRMNQFTEAYTACLGWPAPTHPVDPVVLPGPMDRTHVPVLVLNGELDSLTPAVGGAHVAQQIGSDARAIVVPNMVHLVALDDRYGCGASIYRDFVRRPDRLASLRTDCAATVPEIHTLGSFPRTLADAPPADVVSGPASGVERRLATVLVAAAGDAAYRYQYVDANDDLGLRGGREHYSSNASGSVIRARLGDVKWTVDTTVNGRLVTDYFGLGVQGRFVIRDNAGHRLAATVSWSTTGPHALATVTTATATFRVPAP